MLYLKLITPKGIEFKTEVFNIGGKIKNSDFAEHVEKKLEEIPGTKIHYLFASGQEKHCIDTFIINNDANGIPALDEKTECYWFGDMAYFLMFNFFNEAN